MVFAMMKQTMLTVISTAGTVAPMLSQIIVLNANAITKNIAKLDFFIQWLEMVIATMKQTIFIVTLMEMIVAENQPLQTFVLTVHVLTVS